MERIINFDDNRYLQMICGRHDENLRLIEKELNVKIVQNSKGLKILGNRPEVDKTIELLDYVVGLIDKGSDVKARDFIYALRLTKPDKPDEGVDLKLLAKENID